MERIPSSEHKTGLKSHEIERLAAERLKNIERRNEHAEKREDVIEKAREKIKKTEIKATKQESAPTAEPVVRRPVLTKELSYKNTMASLQHRMKPAARRFSRVIHNPAVEAVSEAAGKTVARPSVTLGATTMAVIITGAVYLYARYQGFEMNGSILWISLIIGALLGLLIEFVWKVVLRRGKKA